MAVGLLSSSQPRRVSSEPGGEHRVSPISSQVRVRASIRNILRCDSINHMQSSPAASGPCHPVHGALRSGGCVGRGGRSFVRQPPPLQPAEAPSAALPPSSLAGRKRRWPSVTYEEWHLHQLSAPRGSTTVPTVTALIPSRRTGLFKR